MTIEPIGRIAALAAAATRRSADAWQVGTVLSGRWLGQSENGRIMLEIDGVTVESAPLQGGQLPTAFQVRVASMGDPPVLEVITEPAPPAMPREVTDALLALLPKQLGQSALLGDLIALARNPALRVLPGDLRAALVGVDSATASPADLTRPDGLRLALAQSGLFHEARLLRLAAGGVGDDASLEDWKTALLRLASALARVAPPGQHAASPAAAAAPPPISTRPLAPQPRATTDMIGLPELLGRMQTHVRGALVRLEIAQLQAHRETPNPIWTFELPAHGANGTDLWQLRIQRERGHGTAPDGSPAPPNWNVAFAVDLPNVGAVHGEVRLVLPRVNVKLWAELAATQRRLEATLPALAQRLLADGLVPGVLVCQQGAPDRPAAGFGARLLSATA